MNQPWCLENSMKDVSDVYNKATHICQIVDLHFSFHEASLLSKLSALLTEWFDVRIDCICGVPRGSFTSLLFSLPAHCCCSKHWEALSKIHRIKSELELLQGFEFISRLGLLCLSHFLFLYLLNNLQSFWKSLFKLFSSVNCSFCSEVADSKIVKILMQLFNKLNLLNSW